jgi:3-oxoacyl-(acyl-carrier-protein) synthase
MSYEQLPDHQRMLATGKSMVAPASWEDLKKGVSGIKRIEDTLFAGTPELEGVRVGVIGATDYEPENDPFITENMRLIDRRKLGRGSFLGLKAEQGALKDAHILKDGEWQLPEKQDGYRIASLTGSAFSGAPHIAEVDFDNIRTGDGLVYLLARIATASAREHGIHGLVGQFSSECASGGSVFDIGAAWLSQYRDDMPPRADIVVVGGADAPVTGKNINLVVGSLKSAGTLTSDPEDASKPLDKSADGLVVAEAGAKVILETVEGARARGLKESDVLAEMVGYASFTDAESDTLAGIEGAARCIEQSFVMGGIKPGEKVGVVVHGTGTPSGSVEKPGGDRREILALKLAMSRLGLNPKDFWLVAPKSYTGHTMGASAAVEANYAISMLQEGFIPGTLKLLNPIEETDGFNFGPAYVDFDAVANPSFGFTGTANCLVFRHFLSGL